MLSMTSSSGTRPLPAAAPLVLRDTDGGIATLALNRPEARNSLSQALLEALVEELAAIGGDTSVRVVILAANGPAFSAGHDLKELRTHRTDPDGGRAFFERTMRTCAEAMQQIVRLPQPVIAVVSGTATAAGCQLVATCDLAIASTSAQFATPGVNIGLFCSTPMVALSRNVARKHAMEMLLTGEMVSAADAVRIGLVNRAVPAGTERAEALSLARKIAAKSTYVVKIGKEAFYRQIEMDLATAYDYAVRVMTENMMARDADEGIAAFIEKRAATWHDH
jgi:enoyl-CoA hydratase/carnithine racemase